METQRNSPDDNVGESRAADDGLWMVLAIIQPFRLDAVTLALECILGFGGMTVSSCRGFGREKVADDAPRGEGKGDASGAHPRRRGMDLGVTDFTEKVKLEIAVVGRDRAEAVIRTVARAAHTGNRGDGKIFAWPIARAVRVGTFDQDARAL